MRINIHYFLIRKYPELIVRLQNSLIAAPDRIFTSMYSCYFNSMNGLSDFKELIPE